MNQTLRTAGAALYNSVVLRSAFWYSVGTVASRVLAFITVPIYALLLTPEQLGTTTLFLTFGRLFLIAASLYLYAVPVRARADYDDAGYRGFISSITALGIATTTVLAIVVTLLPEALLDSFFQLPKPLVVAAVVTTPLTLPFFIMLSVLQAESKAAIYTRFVIIQEVLITAASIALIVIPTALDPAFDGALGRIIGVLVVRSLAGILVIRKLLNGTFYDASYWRYALVYAIPIMPHALASEVLANFDRVMIAQFYSQRETGIYSVAYQFGAVITLLAGAAAAAWGPWFYRNMTDGHFLLIRSRNKNYLLAFTVLTIAAILLSPPVVRLITPAQYWEALPLVPIIMSSGYFFFLHYFFTFIEAQEKRTIYTSIATLFAAGLNIGLNAFLFSRLDYTVAAWTTVASYAFLFIIHVAVVRLILKTDTVNNLKLMLGLSAIVLAVTVFTWQLWSGIIT